MYKVIGIDEAGRGPVLGSLFVGFSIINLESLKELANYENLLKEKGVKDSKLLSPKKRKAIYDDLKDLMDMKFLQITPSLIDANHAKGGKLNELEIEGIINIIDSEKPNLVIIDALTSKPDSFKSHIERKISHSCTIIAENKADVKYPIVGAASIIAKELREEELRQINDNLTKSLNADRASNITGSGYPSDPNTQAFLKEHALNKEFDFIFRKSWETYKNAVKEEFHKTLDDF